jgi:hypothetical protein
MDSKDVIGREVHSFLIENHPALRPCMAAKNRSSLLAEYLEKRFSALVKHGQFRSVVIIFCGPKDQPATVVI